MSPELTLYYQGYAVKDIAKNKKMSRPHLSNKLRKERQNLNLKERVDYVYRKAEVLEFYEDKELVLELLESGVTLVQIALKWDISLDTVRRAFKEWSIKSNYKSYTCVTLSDFYKDWQTAPEDFVLTINKKPMFKVVKL